MSIPNAHRKHTASEAMEEGFRHTGNPYVWGGKVSQSQWGNTPPTRWGCDCSGFVAGIFGMGWLKSTTYTESNNGEIKAREFTHHSYSASKAEPGDIVAQDGHVGFCAEKNGQKGMLQSGGGRQDVNWRANMSGGSWTAIQRPKEGLGVRIVKVSKK